jgi:hypothetical protein
MNNQVTTHKGHQVDGAMVGVGSLFWPKATMELSPLENHAKYCIQHMSDSVSFKLHCFLSLSHS